MSKIIATVTFLITLIGAVIAAESHYAKASDLEQKADAAAVVQLQKELLRDKKEEVEYDLFVLQNKENPTELEEFRIEKLKHRLEELEKVLE